MYYAYAELVKAKKYEKPSLGGESALMYAEPSPPATNAPPPVEEDSDWSSDDARPLPATTDVDETAGVPIDSAPAAADLFGSSSDEDSDGDGKSKSEAVVDGESEKGAEEDGEGEETFSSAVHGNGRSNLFGDDDDSLSSSGDDGNDALEDDIR
jgi:hypothetical protein